MARVPNHFDPEDFRKHGHQVVDELADFLAQSHSLPAIESQDSPTKDVPVLQLQDPDELYLEWKQVELGSLKLNDLFRRVFQQSIRLHHPRFLGHQISPPAIEAALGGLVSDLLNNGMGVFEMGMAGTAIEKVIVDVVAEQFGFDQSADGFLTSGGSLGNLTALLAARSAKVPKTDAGESSVAPAVLVSEQAHYCVRRATNVMGWGDDGVVQVPVDARYGMDSSRLAESLSQCESKGRRAIAVVASACSTATGSYDNLRAIGQFCQDNDLWFHVDGAHGAAAAFSKKYRHRIDGIELADSVVMDFHKLLLTPALATAVIFRSGLDGYRSFAQEASYLFSDNEHQAPWQDLALRTFECTKFMMALKVYSILATRGLGVWEENVTTLFDLAIEMAEIGRDSERIEVLQDPTANIVCYRYLPQDLARANAINAAIRDRLVREGRFYVVQAKVDDTQFLRSTVSNSLTTRQDFIDLFAEIARIGDELQRHH